MVRSSGPGEGPLRERIHRPLLHRPNGRSPFSPRSGEKAFIPPSTIEANPFGSFRTDILLTRTKRVFKKVPCFLACASECLRFLIRPEAEPDFSWLLHSGSYAAALQRTLLNNHLEGSSVSLLLLPASWSHPSAPRIRCLSQKQNPERNNFSRFMQLFAGIIVYIDKSGRTENSKKGGDRDGSS